MWKIIYSVDAQWYSQSLFVFLSEGCPPPVHLFSCFNTFKLMILTVWLLTQSWEVGRSWQNSSQFIDGETVSRFYVTCLRLKCRVWESMRAAQNNIPLLVRGASLAGGIIKFWDRGWEDSLKGIPVTSSLQEMPSPPHSKLCPWASRNCWHHTQEPQACCWCPKWEHSPLPPNVLASWCWRVVGWYKHASLSPSDPWTWCFLQRRVSTDSDTKAVTSVLVWGTNLIPREPGRWQVTWVNVWQQLKSVW